MTTKPAAAEPEKRVASPIRIGVISEALEPSRPGGDRPEATSDPGNRFGRRPARIAAVSLLGTAEQCDARQDHQASRTIDGRPPRDAQQGGHRAGRAFGGPRLDGAIGHGTGLRIPFPGPHQHIEDRDQGELHRRLQRQPGELHALGDGPWIVSGLAQMLGYTYDISQVTIFDNHDLPGHGYAAAEFAFNGHTAQIMSGNNPGSYAPYGSYRLSNYIVNANYLINVPILKSHTDANNQITGALKNHYGSCNPSSLCGDITGMLTLNADAYIRNKTCLILTDVIRATYNGGPVDPPGYWNTFPEHTPNTLFFATDPVTSEYWGRNMINTVAADARLGRETVSLDRAGFASALLSGRERPGPDDRGQPERDRCADGYTGNRGTAVPSSEYPSESVPRVEQRSASAWCGRGTQRSRSRTFRVAWSGISEDATSPPAMPRSIGTAATHPGEAVAPGVYFARVRAGASSSSRAIVKAP